MEENKNVEQLKKYREKIGLLSNHELKMRDLYLSKLAKGDIQGPMTGFASIDKPWLQFFEEENIILDIPKMKTYDYLLTNNFQNKSKNAINYLGKKITFEQLFEKIDDAAKALVSCGVKKGDIITLAMANTPETVYLFYALNRIGAICNVIDPRYSLDEFKREMNNSNTNILISLDVCSPIVSKLNQNGDYNVIYVSALESAPNYIKAAAKADDFVKRNKIVDTKNSVKWNEFIKNGKNYDGNIDCEYEENMPNVLVHTGGTTGLSKGVLLTNENFVAMAHMHKNGGLDYTKDDKFLNILPPFIAYCICNGINMPLTLGLEVTLIPKFNVPEFPNILDKCKPNHVLSGPILWEYVMKSDIKDLSYLKTPVSGGDVLKEESEIRINNFLKSKGCNFKIAQGYGMTEVSSAASFSMEKSNLQGSVGVPFIKNVISVFDPDTFEEKKYGEEGEIWISTSTAMLKYLDNPEETAKLKVKDDYGREWIKTGDIGKITKNGNIMILGRMKRMIVRNGSKIFPVNIENLILQNENIENCAVVGVPDEVERCVPVLHLILKENCSQTKEEIVNYIEDIIKDKMPDYNIPTKYIFRKEMPLTSINKIDFKKLEKEELSDNKIIVQETERGYRK